MADSFDLSRVNAALAGTLFADSMQHLPTVGSTNILALEAAQAGGAHGGVWIADEQTAGRGRSNHTWHSAAGCGLYVSVLLRPRMALVNALWLSLAAGLAVQAAIASATGLTPDIRWPNDLLIGGKKCGGILVETASSAPQPDAPAMLRYAVVGIGINVNHRSFPADLDALATSLRRESGRELRTGNRYLSNSCARSAMSFKLLEAELRGVNSGPGLLERFAASSTWVREANTSAWMRLTDILA